MPSTSAAEVDAFWAGAAPEGRQRFTDVKLIGSGAYSVVARATDTKTGEPVAIKRIAEVFYDAQEAKKVLREIRLLRDFHHSNVISLIALIPPASMETFDDIFMVTSFMESDLRRIIKSRQLLEPGRVRSYTAQLLAGLHHVHCHAGIHRDLKPANILVSPNTKTPATPFGLLRLCDFGLARVDPTAAAEAEKPAQSKREMEAATQVDPVSDPEDAADADDSSAARAPPMLKKQMTSYVVTRWYRAPEVILRERYSSALDMWAVGCILKEMLELTPASKFRTGAIFPGRYCIREHTHAPAHTPQPTASPRHHPHTCSLTRTPPIAPPPKAHSRRDISLPSAFSFDDDQRERQRHDQVGDLPTSPSFSHLLLPSLDCVRHDQLTVISRVLGTMTEAEVS